MALASALWEGVQNLLNQRECPRDGEGTTEAQRPLSSQVNPCSGQDGMGQLWRGTSVCHSTRFLHLPWTGPGSDKGVRVLLNGRMPIHAVTPQQAARTWIGRAGWQGWCCRAPAQQQGSADGYGVRMVSGREVKWAIELGQGDTFHTHYCDMSSACKVRRGKSEVLVGRHRSKPAAAGLGDGTLQQSKAQ